MKIIVYLTLCGILFSGVSCKNKKGASLSAPTTAETQTTTPPPGAEDNYRFIVSFYSSGEGSDYKTKEEFDKFLNSYSKKIAFEGVPWGREGEFDYCFKLNELSSSEQTDFIKKSKELLEKSKLVSVDENQKCVHKH